MRVLGAAMAVVLAIGIACAHAPAAPAAAAVVWPAAPAAPRVRLVRTVTAATPPPRFRWWSKALRVITGTSEEDAAADVLSRPFGVAFLADGSFVVADPDRPGVLAYAPDGTARPELTCKDHPWAAPMAVAADAEGSIWVADAAASAIVRWTAAGCRVLAPDGLERPTGIAAGGGRVLVADPPRHEIVALSTDGAVLWRVGRRGTGEAEFNFPTDVAAAPDGSAWVVDALNFRIVHLGADGAWLGGFGTRGDTGAALARPKGVAVDASGRVWVSDAQRDVLLVFRPDGTLEYVVGESGTDPGRFAHPAGLALATGRLIVADSVNRRAALFEVFGEKP